MLFLECFTGMFSEYKNDRRYIDRNRGGGRSCQEVYMRHIEAKRVVENCRIHYSMEPAKKYCNIVMQKAEEFC